MEGMVLSQHAVVRTNQRGLKREVIETLLVHGRRKRSRGADVYFMDKKARLRAEGDLGRKTFARIEGGLNAYLVVADDGTLVTCAKRLRHFHA